MNKLVQRFSSLVKGTLSGFDRIVFKGLLLPLMSAAQTMQFCKSRGVLNKDYKTWMMEQSAKIEKSAFLNTALQGAYLITAIRSLGLDAGPMSGVNNETLDKEFFPGGTVKSLFICAIGYGDKSKLHPRQPRLDFADACSIV